MVFFEHVPGCPVGVVVKWLLLVVGVGAVGGGGVDEGEEGEEGEGEGEVREGRHCGWGFHLGLGEID